MPVDFACAPLSEARRASSSRGTRRGLPGAESSHETVMRDWSLAKYWLLREAGDHQDHATLSWRLIERIVAGARRGQLSLRETGARRSLHARPRKSRIRTGEFRPCVT